MKPLNAVISLALVCIVCLTSCDKNDKSPKENSIISYFEADESFTVTTRTSGPWELGIVFNASVAGKVTEVGCKMPNAGIYRILIWDFDTKTILRQKSVEQSSPNALTLNAVDPLALEKGKKYVISINSQSSGVNKPYSVVSKKAGGALTPYTKGNILVLNSCYSGTPNPLFPGTTSGVDYEIYGFPEFSFIPD